MLKNEIFRIKIESKNRKYYESILGKKIDLYSVIEVESSKISTGSHIIVTGICDFCN